MPPTVPPRQRTRCPTRRWWMLCTGWARPRPRSTPAWSGTGDNRAASVVPTRIADTRAAKHKLSAGEVMVVQPTTARDVPATGVKAVALNVTATEPERAGFLTVYPCDQPKPVASNV